MLLRTSSVVLRRSACFAAVSTTATTTTASTTTQLLQKQHASTIGQLVDKSKDEWEHRDVLRAGFQDIRFTQVELQKHVNGCAVGMHQARMKAGETVVTSLTNEVENFITVLAGAKAGVKVAAVDPDFTVDSMSHYLSSTNARGLIYAPKVKERKIPLMYKLVPELTVLDDGRILQSEQFPNLTPPFITEFERHVGHNIYRDFLVYDPLPCPLPKLAKNIKPTDQFLITYNNNKANTHTHDNLVQLSQQLVKAIKLTEDDRVCVVAPFWLAQTHAIGLGCVTQGALIVLPSALFDVRATVGDLETEQCTGLVATPQQLGEIVEYLQQKNKTVPSVTKVVVFGKETDVAGDVAATAQTVYNWKLHFAP